MIATIAGYAAVENYGIVGMCARSAGDAIVELFGRENLQKGVLVEKVGDNQVDVSLHVALQYGVSLPAVSQNTKQNVRYRIEDLTGVSVRSVNIFVESIRVQ
ncbi:MAG: Asp23/Gls24 family envelope stress response protein [Clostridia bacterium]|nr:Asp23/Gls24 family envelope stress response protein [Clostridia bacterium]